MHKCLDSIINQKYTNIEVIIIDDGSTDNSYSICEYYASKDERIILSHQDNNGLVYTRKVGLNLASGDYIAFVDADDYIDLDMFSQLVCSLDNIFPDIVAFGLEEVYSDHTVIKRNHYKAGIYNREKLELEIFSSMLSINNFFDFGILPNLVCKLIRKSFFDSCDFQVSDIVSIGEDADATFQLMVQAQSFEIIDIFPYHYCRRSGSMMWRELNIDAIDALETDMKRGFLKVGMYEVMEEQLIDYITYIKLLKNPMSIRKINEEFSNASKRIALYGAGGFGQALYNQYEQSVSMWSDKNYLVYLEKGLPVTSINEMLDKQNQYDLVFIAILDEQLCKQIKDSLIEKGMKNKILFFSRDK